MIKRYEHYTRKIGFYLQLVLRQKRKDRQVTYRETGETERRERYSSKNEYLLFIKTFNYVTATGFEPTTTYFVNEHSTI